MNRKGKVFLGVVLFLFVVMPFIGLFIQGGIENIFYDRIPEEVDQYGMRILDDIADRNYQEVVDSFITEYSETLDPEKDIVALSDLVNNAGDYIGREAAGYHISNTNGTVYYQVTYEMEYSEMFVLYSFVLTDAEGDLKAYSVNVNTSYDALADSSKFTFAGKGLLHYGVLVGVIISLAFSIATAAICFSTQRKRRVLWSLFALCGVGLFTFVWNTGDMAFNLITIGLPTGGFKRAGTLASVVFTLRFPLGALLYWGIKHRSKDAIEEEALLGIGEDENVGGQIL